MIALKLDAPLLNSVARQIFPAYDLEYREGCLHGSVPLSLATVTIVVVPSCSPTHLTLSVPFQAVRADKAPAFLMSKLVGLLWGSISKQIESSVLPNLMRAGLAADTVSTQRGRTPQGDVGAILVSLKDVNRWLADRHPRLTANINEIHFDPACVEIRATLSKKSGS